MLYIWCPLNISGWLPPKHPYFPKNCGECKRNLNLSYDPKREKNRECDKGKLMLAQSLVLVSNRDLCAACEILHKCAGDRTKSQTAIERTHYLHEMKPLLNRKVEKTIEGRRLNVGFTKEGNKHLYSNTFGRTRIVTKEDLKNLATYLENAEYVGDSALTHPRTDNIEHFYYFKVQVNGRWVRLNVAKKARTRRNEQIQVQYFLYSINDIVQKSKSTKGGG